MFCAFHRSSARPLPQMQSRDEDSTESPRSPTDFCSQNSTTLAQEQVSRHVKAMSYHYYAQRGEDNRVIDFVRRPLDMEGDFREFIFEQAQPCDSPRVGSPGSSKSLQSAEVFPCGGAMAYSASSPNISAAFVTDPSTAYPLACLFSGDLTNTNEICELYDMRRPEDRTINGADLICQLYCQDFSDVYGDSTDQPATLLATLSGDFAFVLYDAASDYLLAVRSASGDAPLYWSIAADDGSLLFSSEQSAMPTLSRTASGYPTEFPRGCYFENNGYAQQYEHGELFSFLRQLPSSRPVQPLTRVNSHGQCCGLFYRTMSGRDLATMGYPGI